MNFPNPLDACIEAPALLANTKSKQELIRILPLKPEHICKQKFEWDNLVK